MNINMLRDLDNDPGFYAAACGNDSWKSATLFVSPDDGASFDSVGQFKAAATMGIVIGVLGDFGGGNIPDELNRVTVSLAHGTLSSVSFASFISGAQAAVVGDEILYFRDATLNLDGTYTISGLLRGRRGSEYAMSTHAVGDRFVLLEPSKMIRVSQQTADIGMTRQFKAVTNGATLAATTARTFTNSGAGLKPYAPVQLGGGRDASGNATLNWVRRSRISGEWRDNVEVPLGEASEAYDVEIWDSGYATLKRTISGLTAPTTPYSAADQTTDFGSPQSTIYFAVYQRSDVVGRGYQARGVI